MNALNEFLSSLQVGDPQELGNLVIYPLFAATQEVPFYRLLDEALRDENIEVREVDEFGTVGEVLVINRGDMPVLILDGEILTGAKQNRVVNVTILAAAHSELKIPVSCVEEGRWHSATERFTEDVRFCYAKLRAAKSRQVAENVTRYNDFSSDQGAIWEEVRRKQRKMGVKSATGAVNKVYESIAEKLEEYKKHFTPAEGQTGAAVFINGSFVCIDLFDSPRTLAKLYTKMVESYALDALEEKSTSEKLPEKSEIQDLIGKIAEARIDMNPSVGLGQDLRIAGKGFVGSCLIYKDNIVHLSIFKTEETNESPRSSMSPPSRRRAGRR